jgi:transposase
VPGLVTDLARDELADITRLAEIINALATRIGQRVRVVAPVLLVGRH